MANARRSQAEYNRRMHAVIEYIDRHLDQDLDLGALAAVANFSPFHFHRLFTALAGESLGDYVRRRRLEMAAIRLRSQPALPVLQAALAVGFGSAEAFTRAFRARFNCSPTEWRKRKNGQVLRKRDQEALEPKRKTGGSSKQEYAMNVRLIDREPAEVAYLRMTGPYGPAIEKFWKKKVAPWMEANNLFGRDRYGISLDDPMVTRPDQCRYDACVASRRGEVLAGDSQHKVIPGGRYAALRYEGTGAGIGAAWDSILRDWLPTSGLQLDSRPFFEHYPVDGKYDPKTGVFSCDICVPVTALVLPHT